MGDVEDAKGRVMKRFLLALVLSMLAGWAVPAGSAAARPHTGTWHRLNADQSNPAPEHERLRCREGAARWACPAWFTECADVIRVVEGVATIRPEGEQPFKLRVAYGFLDDQMLYVLIPDALACPWFTSFRSTLRANPFPLPFNGVDWPSSDYIAAP